MYYRRSRWASNLGLIDLLAISPTWIEDFETGWFVDNVFSSLFTEDFESGW